MCSTTYELICTKINFRKYENKSNIIQEDLEKIESEKFVAHD